MLGNSHNYLLCLKPGSLSRFVNIFKMSFRFQHDSGDWLPKSANFKGVSLKVFLGPRTLTMFPRNVLTLTKKILKLGLPVVEQRG